ncbi:hypothetical protein NDK50_21750 [Paraburkholderia bryophila]|uniref:hypothetical protein n=1 Tax=Paraburkholderia bryophila TaxID=420952 RepID=UPI00234ACA7A|nr:hypothetical protein [Paraburkholderia bryophila]WCM23497.1 hypothetical protein NDK50_21750 [Paraburkholderia bryophila]
MRRDKSFASVVVISIAVLALTGCGADDSASNAAPAASSKGMTAANGDAAQRAALPATPILNTSSTLAASAAVAASDPIAQNMQASLAADSQQVAPVMHYAPGDSATSN